MKTRNIDEAAYLLTKGHRPKYTKLADKEAEFTFTNSDAIKKDSQRFLKGDAMVNVTKFLYARTYLKQSLSKEEIIKSGNAKYHGRGYYYIDEHSQPQHSVFGKDKLHTDRLNSGNYFPTKDAAVAQANKQRHPTYTGQKIMDCA